MKSEFQYRLQKSLSASGLSAKELSEKTGISEASISNYINGKYNAKQDNCLLLAEALRVDAGWLMTGNEPKHAYIRTDEEEELIISWRKADDATRTVIRRLLGI